MSFASQLKHKTPIQIRFADIDSFGHANNAKYLTYFEEARINYFNEVVGWDYDWSEKGVIVAKVIVNYVLPLLFGEEVFVSTSCSHIGKKSFELEHRIFRVKDAQQQLVAEGLITMVMFDYEINKTIEIPAEWKSAIEVFEKQS